VIFTHTEVLPAFEGRGVGSALAKGALDAVRAEGSSVEPRCPFIAAYIRRHPAYADLVVGEVAR
jgi:predicted GNAT family acetyltransferase